MRSRLTLAQCTIIAIIIPHSSMSRPSLRVSSSARGGIYRSSPTYPTRSGMSEYDRLDVKYALASCSSSSGESAVVFVDIAVE